MNHDHDAIRALISTWMQATRDGDVDAVTALMAEDVVFLTAGQPPMCGRAAFAQSMRAGMADAAIESSSQIEEIDVCGELAYVRTQPSVTMISRHGKTPVLRTGHTLSILRKGADGRWLLTRDANMLGPPN